VPVVCAPLAAVVEERRDARRALRPFRRRTDPRKEPTDRGARGGGDAAGVGGGDGRVGVEGVAEELTRCKESV
jgi:hypothetical protein